jgi:hypothetical protein
MLVSDLSRFERRTPQAIKQEIACVFYDVTDVEASHPTEISGSIPLHAADRLFLAARRLVEASAAATIQRQGHYGRQMPDRAREHARHVRAGHTKEGSYILPIISKAQAAPDITIENERPRYLIDVEETLFDRRVMTTMAKALEALEVLAVRSDHQPSGSEIMDVIGEGVSRELCKSVQSVISLPEVDEMDLDFSWARAVAPPRNVVKRVFFPKESAPILEQIAERLRKVPREREYVLYGVITDLHHDADENAQGGRVGMETFVEGRKRTIWFALNEDEYQEAHRVHTKQRVMAQGILRTGGRPWTLDVSHFQTDPSLLAAPFDSESRE